ncbi:hypothetical protein A1356_12885 [Methylomonas koyamae]|uniref:Uncharacterized protein n=1 Tax=Methylomonas koyamae TaxID=702114 RepID=A0AA91DCX8_9GAMM|nr:hypothetical protein A1356_12885 [Methylomonas koyamae]
MLVVLLVGRAQDMKDQSVDHGFFGDERTLRFQMAVNRRQHDFGQLVSFKSVEGIQNGSFVR